jgi:hypothetical protein
MDGKTNKTNYSISLAMNLCKMTAEGVLIVRRNAEEIYAGCRRYRAARAWYSRACENGAQIAVLMPAWDKAARAQSLQVEKSE